MGKYVSITHFEIKLNDRPVCHFSASSLGPPLKDPEGPHRYEWMGWYVDRETVARIENFATGELEHHPSDGVEALAEAVLASYRAAKRAAAS